MAVMGEQGVTAPIAAIADAAGISKSGLLHHFPSHTALLLAVIEDANDRFREAVTKRVDLSENHPGKLLRAYVRTLCGGGEDLIAMFADSPLWSGVKAIPEAVDIVQTDVEWWDANLRADGLDPTVVHIVQRAAEGIAVAFTYGHETDRSLAAARDYLLAMTEGTA